MCVLSAECRGVGKAAAMEAGRKGWGEGGGYRTGEGFGGWVGGRAMGKS